VGQIGRFGERGLEQGLGITMPLRGFGQTTSTISPATSNTLGARLEKVGQTPFSNARMPGHLLQDSLDMEYIRRNTELREPIY
jgi:hypothetical protein